MKVKMLKTVGVVAYGGNILEGAMEGSELDVPEEMGKWLVSKGLAAETLAAEAPEIKRLSDVIRPHMKVEGSQVAKEEIEGQEVVIKAFELRPSQQQEGGEYATVQILLPNGNPAWLNIGADAVLETLKEVKDQLPLRAKLQKRKSAKGRTYWVLE
jgi:hypothetical protein